jgi:hypothetical protein
VQKTQHRFGLRELPVTKELFFHFKFCRHGIKILKRISRFDTTSRAMARFAHAVDKNTIAEAKKASLPQYRTTIAPIRLMDEFSMSVAFKFRNSKHAPGLRDISLAQMPRGNGPGQAAIFPPRLQHQTVPHIIFSSSKSFPNLQGTQEQTGWDHR